MKNTEGTHGPAVSPGHLIGGGHYSLHVPLDDEGLLWLAQDEEEQRLAAIRFLPPEVSHDPRTLRILKGRVEAARVVQQENLCRILEWYESPGVEPFIANEYVEGKNVLEAMNAGGTGSMPWERLMPVATSIACGLLTLHRAGVVHHAISPENVMIATDKRVKLLNTVVTGVLRNPLLVPGALNHPHGLRCFSPQQLSGEEPTPADDFYSLGATLFEFLTGTPVFADANSLLEDIQSRPAESLRERLRACNATNDIPPAVVDFIDACLSKNPEERPKSFACLLPETDGVIPSVPRRDEEGLERPLFNSGPVREASVAAAVPVRSDLQVISQARPVRRRSNAPFAMAAALVLLVSAASIWIFIEKQKSRKERLTKAAELAEKEKEEAEKKLQQEIAARLKSDEAAREAQARLAAVSEEKRRLEAQARADQNQQILTKAEEPLSSPKKSGPPPSPSTSTNGFAVMFNGVDLMGWSGDTNYWSVKDGYITAQSTPDAPKQRHLLVWQKGAASDFEMHFSYRFRLLRGNRQPNGGVDYRLTGETNLTCYQFDLVTGARDNGAVTDDQKRARLAGYGESVIATASGTNKVQFLEQVGDTNKLSATRPEDWNKCVIIAKGNRVTHYLNGIMVADVTDEHKRRHTQGLIALELYTRNTNNAATFLQFNDLKLKKLGGTSNSSVASSSR